MEFNKAKVEKEAKKREPNVSSAVTTDNRSVIRAIARFEAAVDMYPTATKDECIEALFLAFYADAKWQPAWEAPFKGSSAAALGSYLKDKLGTPAPRGRRKAEPAAPVQSPDVADPDATLGPDTSATAA